MALFRSAAVPDAFPLPKRPRPGTPTASTRWAAADQRVRAAFATKRYKVPTGSRAVRPNSMPALRYPTSHPAESTAGNRQ
jgi:hypothetical protein